jgi:hypothetical protein
MKLFAFNINAGRCGNSSVTVEAHLVDFDNASARVLNLYYLVDSWFTKPFIGNLVVKDNVPDTFLTRLVLVLFAGNNSDDYNGNGND